MAKEKTKNQTHLVSVFSLSGEKLKDLELTEPYFSLPAHEAVVHQVANAQLSNARKVLAHTKDRSEVRGGGKKPWKQKGTGRARHGSIRSPLWVGGGITFGPRNTRNFSQKVNQKMKQKALFICLSSKVRDQKFFLLENLDIHEPKTKTMKKLFASLPCQGGKTLVAYEERNPNLIQSVKNIKEVRAIGVNSLNVVDLLSYEYFVTTPSGLKRIAQIYKKLNIVKSNLSS